MFIEVRYGGVFDLYRGRKTYIGGKKHVFEDFETDKMSWFELRFMLKKLGVDSDYIVYHCLPGKRLEDGLVVVDCDVAVLGMLSYLDFDVNVVLYIEHLEAGKGVKELLPDCCKPDNVEAVSTVQPPEDKKRTTKVVVDKFPKLNLDKFLPDKVQVVTPEVGKGYWYDFGMEDDAGISREKNTCKGKEITRKRKYEKMKIETWDTLAKRVDKELKSEKGKPKKSKFVEATYEAAPLVSSDPMVGSAMNIKEIDRKKAIEEAFTCAVNPRVVDDAVGVEDDVEDYMPSEEEVEENDDATESFSTEECDSEFQPGHGENIALGDETEDSDIDSDFVDSPPRKRGRKSPGQAVKTGGAFDSDFVDEPSMKQERKPGRPRRAEAVYAGSDCEPEHSKETQNTYSDSLYSHCPSEDVVEVSSTPRFIAFNPGKDLVSPKLEVGMQFESQGQFRDLIRQHAIVNGYGIVFVRNERQRIRVVCY